MRSSSFRGHLTTAMLHQPKGNNPILWGARGLEVHACVKALQVAPSMGLIFCAAPLLLAIQSWCGHVLLWLKQVWLACLHDRTPSNSGSTHLSCAGMTPTIGQA